MSFAIDYVRVESLIAPMARHCNRIVINIADDIILIVALRNNQIKFNL